MYEALHGLEPASVWKFFSELSRFPRPSGGEGPLAMHIADMCREAGMAVQCDAVGNCCIRVLASAGCERAPCVVLQGHLDMVCEKNSGSDFDFLHDSLRLQRVGEWVRADGTTLGADNGIGVAAALAAAFDPACVHGPLEILLTIDEETGLTGARNLDPHLIAGRLLINMDADHSGVLCIGCAGGGGVTVRLPVQRENAPAGRSGCMLVVDGLRGGHSGLDIHENRGNALKLMGRVLGRVDLQQVGISQVQGGDKPNAIPREARALLIVDDAGCDHLAETCQHVLRECRAEFVDDADLSIRVDRGAVPADVLSPVSAGRLVDLLAALPSGVASLSRTIPGLVETSVNLSSLRCEESVATLYCMPRSSCASALHAVATQVAAIGRLSGATCAVEDPYPGWQPRESSALVALVDRVHTGLFGRPPEHAATHAGIECGIIGDRCPGIDMVSFGADIVGCHSPDEAVRIASVATLWQLLCGVLAEIAREE